jgi:hypothetical protein
MHVTGCTFVEAVRRLANIPEPPPCEREAQQNEKPRRPPKQLGNWWREARPIPGTPAEKYLHHRGIYELPPDHAGCLRFHPEMIFGKDGERWRRVPCLIALVRDAITNEPIGLQRVGLSNDGRKAGLRDADGDPLDRMGMGYLAGGCVKLTPDDAVTTRLCIAEGIETALAASLIEHRGALLRPMWATLHADNLAAFPVRPPRRASDATVLPGIEVLTIIADADANNVGQGAARTCAKRWAAAGREAEVLIPDVIGEDFNDLARGAP